MILTIEQKTALIAEAIGWTWQTWGKKSIHVFAPKGEKPNWSGEDKKTNSMTWPIGDNQSAEEAARAFLVRVSPPYFTSADAALTLCDALAKEGFTWVSASQDDGVFFSFFRKKNGVLNGERYEATAPTLAAAICEAYGKAKGLWT